jgi:hypothetical protein
MAVRIADIADAIISRRNVYAAAYQADMTRLTREHGAAAVEAALALIEQTEQRARWDEYGHARAVARGIQRVLSAARRSRPWWIDRRDQRHSDVSST